MRMRQKALLAITATALAFGVGKCSPLSEAHAQERPPVTAPVAPTAESTPAPAQEAKPKTRPADCPSVVYEPDERCGLERRPWKGERISEGELRRGEEALMKHRKFWECAAGWISKWGDKIKAGLEVPPGQAFEKVCDKESDAMKKMTSEGAYTLMVCGSNKTTHAFNLTNDGITVGIIDGPDIFIKWEQPTSSLVVLIQNEEQNYAFKFSTPPRYGIIAVGDKKSELIIWNDHEQMRLYLDGECRPVYEINFGLVTG